MQEEKDSVYLENTVISYYTSRPIPDPIVRVHQEITKNWWPTAIKRYNIFISQMVIDEAAHGDSSAAKKRLEEIKDFTILEVTKDIQNLSKIYEEELKIPPKSIGDAVHLAVACLNNIDYLVTWNCTHLCNGEIIKKLAKINKQLEIHTPIICTPEQLMEVDHGRSDCL